MMKRAYVISAQWEGEAAVWIATSADVPGLVVEAPTWGAMIEEVRLVLPDLLDLSQDEQTDIDLTFRAESHLPLAS